MKPTQQTQSWPNARSPEFLGLCTIIFCVTSGGEAAAQTWDGGGTADGLGNYNWSDGVNWVGDTAPAGGVLNFGGNMFHLFMEYARPARWRNPEVHHRHFFCYGYRRCRATLAAEARGSRHPLRQRPKTRP